MYGGTCVGTLFGGYLSLEFTVLTDHNDSTCMDMLLGYVHDKMELVNMIVKTDSSNLTLIYCII